jgi:hypothetical protein
MKSVQLLMVCAIFNPFCCCTAGVLTADEVKPNPGAHNCCTHSPETSTAPDSHDPESCPHKVLKEYQATALKDLSAASNTADTLPDLLAVIAFLVLEPVAQAQQAVSLATVSHAPPQPLSQVYCVYRI